MESSLMMAANFGWQAGCFSVVDTMIMSLGMEHHVWAQPTGTTDRPRLVVMADMGNEPDEEQQMAHLLMYANRVDLEGLIACSGKYLHANGRRPERMGQGTHHEPSWRVGRTISAASDAQAALHRRRRNHPLDGAC
jgi:hypothetical protein